MRRKQGKLLIVENLKIVYQLRRGCAQHQKSGAGFTLIELLVVMAVLGVLMGIVIVAVNPLEQLARSRDSSRISSIAQIGLALDSYSTSHNGALPTSSPTWMVTLINLDDLRSAPKNPSYVLVTGAGCNSVNNHNGFCYAVVGGDAIVYARVESRVYNGLCSGLQVAWTVYSTADGREGIVCSADASTDPNPGEQVFVD